MLNRFATKLFFSYFILVLIAVSLLVLGFAGLARDLIYENRAKSLQTQGKTIGDIMLNRSADAGGTDDVLAAAGSLLDSSLLVIDRNGRIVGNTGRIRRYGAAMVSGDDLSSVMRGEYIQHIGENPHLNIPVIAIGVPIKEGTETIGAVFLFSPISGLQSISAGITRMAGRAAIAGLLLSLLLGMYLARSITKPLTRLNEASRSMAVGDFSVRVKAGPDEMGQLGQAFNLLAEALQKSTTSLRQEKQRVERIVCALAEGVIAVDKENNVLILNQQAISLLDPQGGHDAADCAMSSWPPEVSGLVRAALAREETQPLELELNQRAVVIVATPLMEAGEAWGAVAVLRDVSDYRRLDLLRRRLVADVSHELRSPLTIIQSYSEALLDDVITEEGERRQYVSGIKEEAVRLEKMVRQILGLARLSGEKPPGDDVIDLTSLGRTVVERYHELAQHKQVALSFSGQPDLMVRGNNTEIEQVLINLLDNAVRVTPPGGDVSIVCRAEGEADVVAEIRDTGSGIPQNEQDLIWERFYKVDRARTPGNSGMGLGLAIVREIVVRHGGSVWLRSEPGKGSVFGFTLPRLIMN